MKVLRAMLLGAGLVTACAAEPNTPAELAILPTVLRPAAKVPPLGPNNWGGCGAVEWAANNFVRNAGNEPVYWRNLHRAARVGPNWFEIDGPGTSWWDLWASGFLSGADLRIYRLVDAKGQPVPAQGDYLDTAAAARAQFVGNGRIVPEGDPNLPDGGWVANQYADVSPNAWIRHRNLSATDASWFAPGRAVWYAVVAVSADGKESELSGEVSATPTAGGNPPPRLLVSSGDDKTPDCATGQDFRLATKVYGGKAPLRYTATLPPGLSIDAGGVISGKPTGEVKGFAAKVTVTDADGRSDQRTWLLAAPGPAGAGKPEPPSNVKAVAGDGFVTLSWTASPSPNVVAYRLKRSTAPKAQQVQRVYVTADTPKLLPWDYIVLSKRFGNFDMKYVNTRVRGIDGNFDRPAWYWDKGQSKVKMGLAPHGGKLPADFVDPGETCLKVVAEAGEQSIRQIVFIDNNKGGESLWYGQFEPGRHYRLEVWMKAEGLADPTVRFGYGTQYPEAAKSFQLTGEWRKYTHEWDAGERPTNTWHFGHTFTFSGPGTLYLDNARIYRCDQPTDAAKPYVPGRTVLDELLASQPATGGKSAHRIWFLDRDATMDSILSWHANAKVQPNWRTAVEGTMEMTLPMGLAFDLATGDSPANRCRPWLVLQHVLHSEADWQALVEYLAAPYDPAKDSARTKPWAARRAAQKGDNRPWTDEFASITIEFGNETWHNGAFDDWLGFNRRNAIHQGGREYGLFCQYLIDGMKKSPYWQAASLDTKIRFNLGANYDTRVEGEKVRGYGEEAMAACPSAHQVGHANYVGPKWETGDYSARTWDDHGVQECLLSFLTGPLRSQQSMARGHDVLARQRPDYDIAAYEGGPGGYALPGQAPPEQVETNERYGKSLAQAVGAFDAWMGSYALGWTDQCFLGYGQGNHWNSHTTFANGFVPTPAWQALALRNRVGAGDLMTVEARAVPTIERGKDSYPLIGGYAMRDGTRWTVFVVSRKLDGNHDKVDFGDGTTPVTLRLPFARAAKVTLHTLTGNPRLTNRDKLNIAPATREVPPGELSGGVLKLVMPPGSIYAYVFDRTE
ncbi:MAG: putative Ig domain-containing protein [Armatimonadetes bacterium]|nr:putative Ig domain-containing protein [Armatimonadota bacterium]